MLGGSILHEQWQLLLLGLLGEKLHLKVLSFLKHWRVTSQGGRGPRGQAVIISHVVDSLFFILYTR